MPLDKHIRSREGPATAELGIQEAQQRGGPFVEAVEATRMPMVMTDPQLAGNPIVFANAAFLEMCGYEHGEVIGQNYLFLADPDARRELGERLLDAIAAGKNIKERLRLRTKDGRERWVLVFIHPVADGDRVVRHFASFLDITDQVNREHDLRRATELLDQRIGVKRRQLHEVNDRLNGEVERRRRTEAVLRDALAEVERDLRFRDFLLHEVNHRTKNALQLAASLLGIQARQSSDPATREALETAMGRLQRIGEVHGLLAYQTDAPDHVDCAEYLRRICRTMMESLAPAGQVQVDVDVQSDAIWSSDLVVPLGLIVGEALTNALKHAFPEGRSGRIEVQLRSWGDGRMRLCVGDDGVGLPEQPRVQSLGLRLIETLAKQLGGEVSLDAREEGGTTLLVTFPDPNASGSQGKQS